MNQPPNQPRENGDIPPVTARIAVDSRLRPNNDDNLRARRLLTLCYLLLFLVHRVSAADGPPVAHRFLGADYVGNKVAIIGADGKIEWEFPAINPQDCWRLTNGNVLFCELNGVKEVTANKQIVWRYDAPSGAQCHSCQPLPEGRVLVAECSLGRLVEVGRDGKIAREIKVPSAAKVLSHQFRGTRKTADGYYWVCLMDEQKVLELSPGGGVLREIPVPGYPHEAIKLPDGHLLITLGMAKRVIELDEHLKIVWQIEENDVPGNPLRLPAACQRFPNGNTIIGNWLGGGFIGKQPQAFEVTRDKQVVWEFANHAQFKTMNQIQVLDTSADPAKGELLR